MLQEFENDGVVYLELRTTPRATPSEGLTSDDYVRHILDCISSFNVKSTSMKTHLILSIDRRNTPETAMQVVNLAHKYQSRGVVGIDLVSLTFPVPCSLLAMQIYFPAVHSTISQILILDVSGSVEIPRSATCQSSSQHSSAPKHMA